MRAKRLWGKSIPLPPVRWRRDEVLSSCILVVHDQSILLTSFHQCLRLQLIHILFGILHLKSTSDEAFSSSENLQVWWVIDIGQSVGGPSVHNLHKMVLQQFSKECDTHDRSRYCVTILCTFLQPSSLKLPCPNFDKYLKTILTIPVK